MMKFIQDNGRALLLAIIIIAFMSIHLATRAAVPAWIIREEIYQQGIKEPEIVFAQAMLESGWGKCSNCSLSLKNNVFGFTSSGVMSFSHWRESVRYYCEWQEARYTGGDYFQFLCKYWGAPDMDGYISKIRIILNNTNKVK